MRIEKSLLACLKKRFLNSHHFWLVDRKVLLRSVEVMLVLYDRQHNLDSKYNYNVIPSWKHVKIEKSLLQTYEKWFLNSQNLWLVGCKVLVCRVEVMLYAVVINNPIRRGQENNITYILNSTTSRPTNKKWWELINHFLYVWRSDFSILKCFE